MAPHALFAAPRDVADQARCGFYHTIELPGQGCLQGIWDLRKGIGNYLGGVHFAGKRVLDVGTATGFLTFSMEKQGAEVISYDLSPQHRWDLVPHGRMDWKSEVAQTADSIEQINNSYWYCHRALASRARVVYGTVYGIPKEVGPVDIVTVGSILCHLRDPMLALHNAVRLAQETVIVADTVPRRKVLNWLCARALPFTRKLMFRPVLRFLPRFEDGHSRAVWWDVSPEVVRQFLGFLGFEDSRINFHHQYFHNSPRLLYTIVARRTSDTPPLEMFQTGPAGPLAA